MEILKNIYSNIDKCTININEIKVENEVYPSSIQINLQDGTQCTLGQLVFYLINRNLSHSDYLAKCSEIGFAPISYVDRTKLLNELGDFIISDQSITLENPIDQYLCNKDFSYIFDIFDQIKKRKSILTRKTKFKIVVPSSIYSKITLANIESLLVTFEYKENVLEENLDPPSNQNITRNGILYEIVDNVSRFTSDDWESIVAIFLDGSNWQFKNWNWKSLVDIFYSIPTFFIRYSNEKISEAIKDYKVNEIIIDSETKRCKKADIEKIWEMIENAVEKINE
ncbi:Cell division cycle protein 73 [Astathelohania contejeani]|uniref:Cell division cycle protein 73 n=1 Tax=Astathelohania contejeani TaxID=164912 RepID=A0ABQ7HZM2_9MICR|nr:Cell division cycle protein 73 [Thelohania contejeani]